MATVYLGRSDDDFDYMTMRQIITMIGQWRKIEAGKYQLQAYVSNGGNLDDLVSKEELRKRELELGDACW